MQESQAKTIQPVQKLGPNVEPIQRVEDVASEMLDESDEAASSDEGMFTEPEPEPEAKAEPEPEAKTRKRKPKAKPKADVLDAVEL